MFFFFHCGRVCEIVIRFNTATRWRRFTTVAVWLWDGQAYCLHARHVWRVSSSCLLRAGQCNVLSMRRCLIWPALDKPQLPDLHPLLIWRGRPVLRSLLWLLPEIQNNYFIKAIKLNTKITRSVWNAQRSEDTPAVWKKIYNIINELRHTR